jgi:cob(I)alamin adenosyltransferase
MSFMVKLTKIYTRGGDKGETSLGDGARVKKHDARIAAVGAVDEANAALGAARLHAAALPDIERILARVQNEMFDLGADLSVPLDSKNAALRITDAQVTRLEQEIDRINAPLPPLNSFVLPAGSPAAVFLHLARTAVRKAEREMTALAETSALNVAALAYINRLSDLIFVMTRHANQGGVGDVLWVPGKSRT